MKKKILSLVLVITGIVITSCTSKKETAASIAQKWCDLNGKAFKAEGSAKEAAQAAVKKFEDEIEAKYKSNDAFMKEVGVEVEKCEDASEGR